MIETTHKPRKAEQPHPQGDALRLVCQLPPQAYLALAPTSVACAEVSL